MGWLIGKRVLLALPAVLAALAILVGGALALFTDTASVPSNTFTTAATFGAPWWDTGYAYRQKITVTGNAATAAAAGKTIRVSLNTASLVSGGKMQPDGDDLRIAYWNGATSVELDRQLFQMNSSATHAWFPLQATIGNGATDEGYYLYYGNTAAVSPPTNLGATTAKEFYSGDGNTSFQDATLDCGARTTNYNDWGGGNQKVDAEPGVGSVSRANAWTTGLTHTVGSGSNRLLLFVVGYENSSDPGVSAVTYGGQALTRIIGRVAGTTTVGRVELWYLNEASIAAASGNTFTVTWGGAAPSYRMYAAATYAGVNQSTPILASSSNSTNSSTPNPITTSVSVAAGAMAVSGVISGNNGSYTWGGGWTEGTDQTSGSTTTMSSAEHAATADGTDTASATHSGPNRQAIVAAALSPPASCDSETLVALMEWSNFSGSASWQVPTGARIVEDGTSSGTRIRLWGAGNSGNGIAANAVLESWSDSQATWNSRQTGIAWSGNGGAGAIVADNEVTGFDNVSAENQESASMGTSAVTWGGADGVEGPAFPFLAGTATAQRWVLGVLTNTGLVAHFPFGTGFANGVEWRGEEDGTATTRPRLVIVYYDHYQPEPTTSLGAEENAP